MLEEFERWFTKERAKLKRDKNNNSRRAKRRYLHFDTRITDLNKDKTFELLQPQNIADRSFYPFIRLDTKKRKFRRVEDPKGNIRKKISIKPRPIDYASHKDALVYSWYGDILSQKYEVEIRRLGLENNAIAYRSFKENAEDSGKTNVDFAKEVFDCMGRNIPCQVLAIDISKFFQEIDHEYLKKQWCRLLGIDRLPEDHFRVFKNITNYRFVRKGRIGSLESSAKESHKNRLCTPKEFQREIIQKNLQELNKDKKGIPQGAPISCVLANLYMIEFDSIMNSAVQSVGGLYRRYSDDILIICPPEEATAIEKLVYKTLENPLKLKANPDKTEKWSCAKDQGGIIIQDLKTGKEAEIQYLGLTTDGSTIDLRQAGLNRFQNRRQQNIKHSSTVHSKYNIPMPEKALRENFGKVGSNYLAYMERAHEKTGSEKIKKKLDKNRGQKQIQKQLEAHK